MGVRKVIFYGITMSYICCFYISSQFIIDEVEPLVRPNGNCREFLKEAYRWHLVPEERNQMSIDSPVRTKPRNPNIRIIAVGSHEMEVIYNIILYNTYICKL